MIWMKILRTALVLLWIFIGGALGISYSEIGCFSSLPSSYSLNNSYEYQSLGYCSGMCEGMGTSYMALYDHDECYCGDDDPTDTESTSDDCTATCYGYPAEYCGGTDSYLVYELGTDTSDTSNGSSSVTAADSSLETSTTSSLSSASTSTKSATAAATLSDSASTTTFSSSTSNTAVIYSTSTQIGGSTIVITATLSVSATASSSSSSSSKSTNIAAIVGGTVGGLAGLLLIAVITILILRYYSRRKENERLEKEYQEAIKPVDYDENKDNIYASSVSDSHGPLGDPFDDSRRISTGSLVPETHLTPNGLQNKLTVVNPDQ